MRLESCDNCGVVLNIEEFREITLDRKNWPSENSVWPPKAYIPAYIFVRADYGDKFIVCPVCSNGIAIE